MKRTAGVSTLLLVTAGFGADTIGIQELEPIAMAAHAAESYQLYSRLVPSWTS